MLTSKSARYSEMRKCLTEFEKACIDYGSSLSAIVSLKEMDDCSDRLCKTKLELIHLLDRLYFG